MCSTDGLAIAYRDLQRRARKQHRCDECDRLIPVGTSYVYVSGISEDHYPFTGHVHLECNALWIRIWKELCGGHGVMLLGGLEEEIRGYEDAEPSFTEEGDRLPHPLRAEFEAIREKYSREVRA